jgi:hypothetical protein
MRTSSPTALRRRYLTRMGIALWQRRGRPAQGAAAVEAPVPVRLLAVHAGVATGGTAAARLLGAMLRSVGAGPEQLAAGPADLRLQLRGLRPRALLVFGEALAAELLRRPGALDDVRGEVWTLPESGIPLIVTATPESLLHDPAGKAAAWDDLKRLLRCVAETAAPGRA